MKYILEDAAALAVGHVVVADGCKLRMLVTKVIVGFAECTWFERRFSRRGRFLQHFVRTDLFHVSVLTLAADQKWREPYEEPR